jgi:hypothetical protein
VQCGQKQRPRSEEPVRIGLGNPLADGEQAARGRRDRLADDGTVDMEKALLSESVAR